MTRLLSSATADWLFVEIADHSETFIEIVLDGCHCNPAFHFVIPPSAGAYMGDFRGKYTDIIPIWHRNTSMGMKVCNHNVAGRSSYILLYIG